jgi:hypothetical protein
MCTASVVLPLPPFCERKAMERIVFPFASWRHNAATLLRRGIIYLSSRFSVAVKEISNKPLRNGFIKPKRLLKRKGRGLMDLPGLMDNLTVDHKALGQAALAHNSTSHNSKEGVLFLTEK